MSTARIAAGAVTLIVLAGACRQIPPPDTSSEIAEPEVEERQGALTALSRTGWTASASVGANPGNAIDGSTTTRWTTGVNQANNQWFQIDLGSQRTFTALRLDTTTTPNDYPRSYKVQVANNTTSWGTAPNVATGIGTSAVTLIGFASQSARYIRVTLTGAASAPWSIYDVNVYDAILPRTGWAATASINSGNAGLSIDGSTTTRWNTGTTNQINGQWLQVNMASPQTFSQIVLDTGSTVTNQFPRGYAVTTSNDGTTFGPSIASGAGTGRFTVINFPMQQARYVRITLALSMTVNTPWAVEELNISGQPTVPTTHVRSGVWTATAASNNGTAGNAIDGNTSTSWTSATPSTNQWFQVDMGTIRTFTQVVVDAGTTATARTYQLQISNNGMAPWTTVTSLSGTAATVTINVPAQTSRFIRINQTATSSAAWPIRELNVSGGAFSRPGWLATAFATGGTTDTADKAIDGNATTRWNSGVAQSNNNQTFQLDMGTAQVFNQVTLDAGTSTGNYPRGYSVSVSTDGTNWGSAVATGTGSTQFVTINFLTQTARFIRITQTGSATNNWSIHELNVWRLAQLCDAVTCTPSDQCHLGVCDPNTGACTNPAKPNGTACNDGNACTTGEACQSGACNGGTAVTCTTDQCHTIGACVPATGCPAPINKPNGAVCSDGNACTETDICQSGTCTGLSPVTCPAPDPCHGEGTCNPATGACAHPNMPNGTVCTDFNACTNGTVCQNGACTGGTPVICTASDPCHNVGTCNSSTGVCSNPAKADGAACNDGNACTRADSCQTGVCTGADPVQCVASDGCHSTGTCNPQTGACSNAGTTCEVGVFDYDDAGRLVRDRGARLAYNSYDQLTQVTPTSAGPLQLSNVPIEYAGFPGATFSVAGGVNKRGEIAGYGILPGSGTHAFLWKRSGVILDLNTFQGGIVNAYASSINDEGTVVGFYFDNLGRYHTYRYGEGSGFEDLGVVANAQPAPSSINSQGQFAGNLYPPGGGSRGFRYTDGIGFEDIGMLPGGTASQAFTVDATGTVYGSSRVADTPTTGFNSVGRAVMYTDGVGLQDLNDLVDPIPGLTLLTAIRSSGDLIVGTAWDGSRHVAYRLRLSTGVIEEVDAPWSGGVFGYGINSFGEMVGTAFVEPGSTQRVAWIYTDALGFRRLDELIDPNLGWGLIHASEINDAGDVVGLGTLNGVNSAFVVHLPLRQSASGVPTAAVAHTYGYDGQRTSTTTSPGTPGAATQVWFTQDYSEHDGVREHYVRVGDRIVARVTARPTGPPAGAGIVRTEKRPATGTRQLAFGIGLMLLALGTLGFGLASRRRRRWIPGLAGVFSLLLGAASCGVMTRQASELWAVDGNVTHFFHVGLTVGPNLITDRTGALVEERRYEPFGQPIGDIHLATEPQNILGKLTDPSTGWSYHGARWMQPQTARWTAPDPLVKGPNADHLSEPWALSPYAYANQSPSRFWDPTGLESGAVSAEAGRELAKNMQKEAAEWAKVDKLKQDFDEFEGQRTDDRVAMQWAVMSEKERSDWLNCGSLCKNDIVTHGTAADRTRDKLQERFYNSRGLVAIEIAGTWMAVGMVQGAVFPMANGFAAGKNGGEVFFRAMKASHAARLQSAGRVAGTGETFIATERSAALAMDGVVFEFRLQSGTMQQLERMGVSDMTPLVQSIYPNMTPVTSLTRSWTATNALFKAENGFINIGLGRGRALDLFNNNILSFRVIRP